MSFTISLSLFFIFFNALNFTLCYNVFQMCLFVWSMCGALLSSFNTFPFGSAARTHFCGFSVNSYKFRRGLNEEEKVLTMELGDEYIKYTKRTKRLIPYILWGLSCHWKDQICKRFLRGILNWSIHWPWHDHYNAVFNMLRWLNYLSELCDFFRFWQLIERSLVCLILRGKNIICILLYCTFTYYIIIFNVCIVSVRTQFILPFV